MILCIAHFLHSPYGLLTDSDMGWLLSVLLFLFNYYYYYFAFFIFFKCICYSASVCVYSLNKIYLLVLQNRALRSWILILITMTIRLAAEDLACLWMKILVVVSRFLTPFLLAYRIAALTKMQVTLLQMKMVKQWKKM